MHTLRLCAPMMALDLVLGRACLSQERRVGPVGLLLVCLKKTIFIEDLIHCFIFSIRNGSCVRTHCTPCGCQWL